MKWAVPAGLLLLLPSLATAQSLNIDLGAAGQAGATGRLVQLTALITVLSIAPSLLVMVTGFTRIVIVLSLLRSAIGAQSTPPNTVLIGLALVPDFLRHAARVGPSLHQWPVTDERRAALGNSKVCALPPSRSGDFMAANVRGADLQLFLDMAHLPPAASADAAPWRALIPAFSIGELRRAFEMGFLLYLPFLVIDMVVGSVLMSLGMMMLPPSGISLPFKLIFFVLIDGWRLVSGGLVQGFVPGG